MIGRVAVLERLFESLSAAANAVDFGGVREAEFWDGLRDMANEMADATEEMKAAGDALYELARDGEGLKGGAR